MRKKFILFSVAALCAVFLLPELRGFATLSAGSEASAADDVIQDANTQDSETQDDVPQVPKFADTDVQFFEEQIEPLLKQNCLTCHSGAAAKGGLRMDYRGGLIAGGDTGPAVNLEAAADSLLIEAVKHLSYEMPPPPADKLGAQQIAALEKWIDRGLPWTPGADVPPAGAEGDHHGPPPVNDETKAFWSFQPVQRPAVPVLPSDWMSNPIDAFILARLRSEGVSPAARADKAELIRRVTYDLTGLPPDPAEVAAFLADDSADAYEKVVDRLLDSPRFGEHWARHWLDLVRYAETNSYERDGDKPFVWRYRDYVIRSLNDDKPYDQFLREQLAGDELDQPTPDSIIATGYYRLGLWDDEPADPRQARFDELDDILATTGQAFMGLTIGCARCHDHKLDPIPQRDYYQMLAFFTNIRRYGVRAPETVMAASVRMVGSAEDLEKYKTDVANWRKALAELDKTIGAIEAPILEQLKGGERDDFKYEQRRLGILKDHVPDLLSQDEFDEYAKLVSTRTELRQQEPPGLDQALCVKELGTQPEPTHLLIRGNANVPGEEVQPNFLEVLGFPEPQFPVGRFEDTSGRRRVFADWLTSEEHPLTARVMVNRLWERYMRRGIVATTSDFGLTGAAPSHPRLLDWLAAELVDGGWRMKRMHKLIVMSSAYRMTSRVSDDVVAKDPENKLFGRQTMRRLRAEEIRDSILAVIGRLNTEKMYGPSVFTKIPAAVLAGQSKPGDGWGRSSDEDRARRSVYVKVKRSLITPLLASFDYPETDFSCPERFATTQPTQALGMLNSEFIVEQAGIFADELRAQASSPELQIKLALSRVTQRTPSAEEVSASLELLQRLQNEHELSADQALEQFCVVALNLNEFFYLD